MYRDISDLYIYLERNQISLISLYREKHVIDIDIYIHVFMYDI